MHIENLTINVGAVARPTLADLLPMLFRAELSTSGGKEAAPPATAEKANTPPAIGQVWPGQGGIYAGVSRGEDGAPDCHLILSPEKPEAILAWAAALEWAKTVETDSHTDFSVPTRFESALLYANLRDQFDTDNWHWTSTQYSDAVAWSQYFGNGSQGSDGKKFAGAVRAVRRFPA